jgi:acetyltransferase-like isoleucine patch superfamily enzyme
MSAFDRLILKIKRGDGPLYGIAKSLARMLLSPQAPRIPNAVKPLFRFLYELHYLVVQTWRTMLIIGYRHPLFQGRCASFGKNVSLDGLPYINGHTEIHIGDNVWLGGGLDIISGRFLDNPKLIIKDNAQVSWNVRMTVNQEVVIEENARISFDCRISDSDGHPREADLRRQNAPVSPKDIRPVRICRDAWIGNGAHIMKGVTVGEGAVVGANSVVITDVPPYALALGNPAEVYFKSYGRPSDFRKKKVPEAQEV